MQIHSNSGVSGASPKESQSLKQLATKCLGKLTDMLTNTFQPNKGDSLTHSKNTDTIAEQTDALLKKKLGLNNQITSIKSNDSKLENLELPLPATKTLGWQSKNMGHVSDCVKEFNNAQGFEAKDRAAVNLEKALNTWEYADSGTMEESMSRGGSQLKALLTVYTKTRDVDANSFLTIDPKIANDSPILLKNITEFNDTTNITDKKTALKKLKESLKTSRNTANIEKNQDFINNTNNLSLVVEKLAQRFGI